MAFNLRRFFKGLLISQENTLTPKEIQITPGGAADTKTTLVSSQTSDVTLTLPDATDTIVARDTVDTLTNKTINGAEINDATHVTVVGDVTIGGDLTVNGTTTTVNTDNLDVEDKNITVNVGGNDASSEGAGLTVDRTSTDGSLIFKDTSPTKWASGLLGSEDNLVGETVPQTLENKTLTEPNIDIIVFPEQLVSPSIPSAGTGKVYYKDDGYVYLMDDAGLETVLGTDANITFGHPQLLTGTVDGINDTFGPLAKVPNDDDSVIVYLNGVAVSRTNYNISSGNVVFTAGNVPQLGDVPSAFILYREASPSLPPLSGTFLAYQGPWDASTNIPALTNGVGTNGYFYIVSASGTVDFGSGPITFTVGDWVFYNGFVWSSVNNSAAVNSTLSNLASPTAVNQHLLPSADLVRNLGSLTHRWASTYTNTLTVSGAATFASGASMQNQPVTDVLDPVNPQDAATKAYVDDNTGAGGIQKVVALDVVSSTLPTGSVFVDSVEIFADDLVLFNELSVDNNRIYMAVGTGSTITSWTAVEFAGSGSLDASSGDFVQITQGAYYKDTTLFFDGVEFKNLLNNKISSVILDASTDVVLFGFDKTLFKHMIMEYGISKNGGVRTGLLMIATNGTDVNYSDQGPFEVGTTGVTLDVVIVGAYVVVRYSSTMTSADGKFTRTLRVWE